MKKLIRQFKKIRQFKEILSLDQSKNLRPTLLFLKENLIQNCNRLQKEFKKDKNLESLDTLKKYSRIIEIITEIDDDLFLENVGFEFVESGEYKGIVEIQDELFYQWETKPLPEKKTSKNKKLIQRSIILEKREWKELRVLLKQIIDESGI